jgi:RNA polymerase sigma-70 factor (ECF subfamily)
MREEQSEILAALDEISPTQREVIELAYFGGLSQSQIAERLKQPLGTVKTRVRMGLQNLRVILEKRGLVRD